MLVSGASGGLSPAAFVNPTGQDMEVLEVKFELSGANQAGSSQLFGGSIWCELKLGAYKLTNGSIPVWLFGRAENLIAENTIGANGEAFCAYSWRLPRPLFVPAGATVSAKFTHTGFIAASVNVRMGLSARTVFRAPKTICVPWVAKYVSKAFNPIADAAVDQSTELDLVNDNAEVLRLQRFVGRTLYIGSDGVVFEDFPQWFGSQYLTLRMVDSFGRPIVRAYTPFRSVFHALTRSWELEPSGAEMDPFAFYIINLKKLVASVAAGGPTGAQAQAMVSLVGWREVAA